MRSYVLFLILLGATTPSGTDAASNANCPKWMGRYTAALRPSDSFTGEATRLELSIDKRGIGWSVSGDGVPEIVLSADRYRCDAKGVTGSFSGAQLQGDFRLTKKGSGYVFDASRVGNDEAAQLNYVGYVPNRPVPVKKVH